MTESTELPLLQVHAVESLVPHEDHDPRRIEKLSQRIQQEGILNNPPVVAPLPDNQRYVILDGANRAMAFSALGIPHIVAQLVAYQGSGVVLETWYHVVSGMRLEEFEDGLAQVAGMDLQECSLDEARHSLEADEALAYIVCENGVRKVPCREGCQPPDLQVLNHL